MKRINFKTLPLFETERLILRQIEDDDANAIMALRSNPEVNKYIDRPSDITMENVKEFIEAIKKGESLYRVIILKENYQLIGTVCLWQFSFETGSAEIGYELLPQFSGKGYMQEAVSKVIEFGFNQLELQKIDAFTTQDNERSIKLLDRLHFVKNNRTQTDESVTIICYSKESDM